jgi:hypothetical protein
MSEETYFEGKDNVTEYGVRCFAGGKEVEMVRCNDSATAADIARVMANRVFGHGKYAGYKYPISVEIGIVHSTKKEE